VRVGIDDFDQKLVGKPSRINVPAVGSILRQGEKGTELEIDGKNIDILSPVSGEVIEVNKKSLESTGLVNKEPYEQGWLFKIRSENLSSNLNNLLHGSIARAWIQDTVDKLSNRITNNYGVVMQDGGVISNGFIKELAPENWEEVAADFFLTNDRQG
jgi:glycine cleavage system H protein